MKIVKDGRIIEPGPACRNLNPHLFESNENRSSPSHTEPQSTFCNEPVAEKKGKEANPKRFRVCVISFRQRLTDPDNLCPKYFIDCLRYSEIIPDDSSREIELVVRQQKVKHRSEERTELFVDPC